MLPYVAITLVAFFHEFSTCQDISHVEDIKVLSELPLEKLLSIKRDFTVENIENANNFTDEGVESKEIPHTLALKGKVKLKDRGGYGNGHGSHPPTYVYEEYVEKESKGYKIQSIFQLSVTSLAFLAFGGYLLCLLIHAIKSKQNLTNNNAAATQALAAFLASKIRKIRNKNRLRKRRKNVKLQRKPNVKKPNGNGQNTYHYQQNQRYTFNNTKPSIGNVYLYNLGKREPRPKRDVIEFEADHTFHDDMYNVLLNLSEAYAKYHTVDYLHYNRTKVNN